MGILSHLLFRIARGGRLAQEGPLRFHDRIAYLGHVMDWGRVGESMSSDGAVGFESKTQTAVRMGFLLSARESQWNDWTFDWLLEEGETSDDNNCQAPWSHEHPFASTMDRAHRYWISYPCLFSSVHSSRQTEGALLLIVQTQLSVVDLFGHYLLSEGPPKLLEFILFPHYHYSTIVYY
jgi:hypothetical protein